MNYYTRKRRIVIFTGISISLLTFALYIPALTNNFVTWDDDYYVFMNENIKSLNLRFLQWAFTTFHASNWHPLTWLSLSIDHAIYGLNPHGFHLTNNIIHSVNTFLVFILSYLLLSIKITDRKQKDIIIASAIISILFGIHPIHVESVAWISERKDLLYSFFYLLSVIFYTLYLKNRGGIGFSTLWNRWYILSFISFLFSILSKPMAVTLPLVLLIVDWYPSGRLRGIKDGIFIFSEKVPFFLLSILCGIFTIMAQKGALTGYNLIPLYTRFLVITKALVDYSLNIFLPIDLTPLYPYPEPWNVSILKIDYLIPLLSLILAVVFLISLRRYRVLIALFVYYLISLAPVLGIIQVGAQYMADRYMYLPSLTFFIPLGLLWFLFERMPVMKRALVSIILLISFMLSIKTYNQIHIWQDGISLWNHILEKVPYFYEGYKNRGDALRLRGDYQSAIDDYSRAIYLNRFYLEAYYERSNAYVKIGRYKEALEDIDYVLQFTKKPEYLNTRGVIYSRLGDIVRAIEDYKEALKMDPGFYPARKNYAIALIKLGKDNEARKVLGGIQ